MGKHPKKTNVQSAEVVQFIQNDEEARGEVSMMKDHNDRSKTSCIPSPNSVESYLPGWWFGTFGLLSIIYWECHHPNWLSYFSEGEGIPPTSFCDCYNLMNPLSKDLRSQLYIAPGTVACTAAGFSAGFFTMSAANATIWNGTKW